MSGITAKMGHILSGRKNKEHVLGCDFVFYNELI